MREVEKGQKREEEKEVSGESHAENYKRNKRGSTANSSYKEPAAVRPSSASPWM